MTKVAARFNMSDVAFRKWCIKSHIPLPGRGYWRRAETGKSVERIPLPQVKNLDPIRFRVRKSRAERASPVDADIVAYEVAHPIVVPTMLRMPEPEAEALIRDFRDQKPDEYGVIKSKGSDTFQVRIHPSSRERVIRLANALVRACRERGFAIRAGTPSLRYWSHLSLEIDSIEFYLAFDERMRRVSHPMTEAQIARKRQGHYVYVPHSYEPTGELTLKIEGCYRTGLQSSWTDGKRQKIEMRLNEVMIGLRTLAVHRTEEQRTADEQRRQQEIVHRQRAAIRERITQERGAVRALETDSVAWERAERLRAFIRAVERHHKDAGTLREKSDWLEWAQEQADRADPLLPNPPSILDTPKREYSSLPAWLIEAEEQFSQIDVDSSVTELA